MIALVTEESQQCGIFGSEWDFIWDENDILPSSFVYLYPIK